MPGNEEEAAGLLDAYFEGGRLAFRFGVEAVPRWGLGA